MKFTPKTDKELSEDRLLPPGEYDFQISQGLYKTSNAGNEMIELLVRVYKPDGNFILVTDYLMEKIMYKIKHACDACGLTNEYNNGTLHGDDFFGKTGKLKLKIQVDKTGQYPDKNVIQDYIVPSEKVAPKPASTKSVGELMEDDTIPF